MNKGLQMVRQIIKPTSEFYNVHIPKEYINQEVEIMVLPLFNLDKSINTPVKKKNFNPEDFYASTKETKDSIDKTLLKLKGEWK